MTFDPGSDRWPVWTPDGKRIVFGSDRARPGISNLYWVNADGTGEVTRLHESPQSDPMFSPDGRPDGQRIALVAPNKDLVQDKVVFVSNFSDYLRKIAPGRK